MQKYQDVVLNQNGNPVSGVQVTVTDLLGTPVSVYSANAIGLNVNPLTSDNNGRFSFYAPDGRYNLSFSFGGNVVASITDILLEDPMDGSDAVFNDVTILGGLSDASKITSTAVGGLSSTNVQAALEELDDEKIDASSLAASGGSTLVGFSPVGGLTATNVQAALAELDGEKASISDLSSPDGAKAIGFGSITVDDALKNVPSMDLSILPSASTPIADTDLLLVRQGTSNKKVTADVFRVEVATVAQAAEAGAIAAKLAAQTAQAGAEAARDATIISAAPTIFATTAAGLAATTSGQYFSVPSPDSAEYLILYLNSAGVAVEQKRYPSAEVVKNLASTAVPGVEYAIQDSNDNASEYIEPATGKRYVLAIDADDVNGIPRYRLNKATRSAPKLNASIVHHISYGQSLALGNVGSIHTLPNGDADGFFDSVMFNANGVTSAGPRAQEGSGTVAQNHASLIPYLEQPLVGNAPNGNFETPLGNALRTVKRLLRDEDGVEPADFDYILLGSAPGQSNTAIAGLAKGSAPYTNLINDVTYGLSNAQTAGKSYAVDVVYWSQGERDIQLGTARLTYKNALLQLYTDLNTDIKAITGQSHDIKIVMYQCSVYNQFTAGYAGANIALAQLDAAKANSNIVLATSIYALEHFSATNVHLAGVGYANLGGYYGLAAKRAIVDGAQWVNLYPTRLTRQGAILEIEFPDTGYPIAASSTLFPSQANYGLTAVGVDGVTDNPIVSVTVTAPRRVRVVLTNALPGYLRYGFASWGGNLHDTCDIDPGTARSLTLYRPVLTFDEAFQ